jgi:hypothetical protein
VAEAVIRWSLPLSESPNTNFSLVNNGAVAFNTAGTSTLMTLSAGGTSVAVTGSANSGAGSVPCCTYLNGPAYFVGQLIINGLTGSGSNSRSASNLAPFEGLGAGTVTATVVTSNTTGTGSSTDPNSSQLSYGGSGSIGAILTVTYNFSEVSTLPEPATCSLVGGALLAAFCFIRRRRSQRS